jgi:hypothetical protein
MSKFMPDMVNGEGKNHDFHSPVDFILTGCLMKIKSAGQKNIALIVEKALNRLFQRLL